MLRILDIDRNEVIRQLLAPDFGDAVAQVVACWRLEKRATVFDQAKGDARVCDCKEAGSVGNMCRFSRIRL